MKGSLLTNSRSIALTFLCAVALSPAAGTPAWAQTAPQPSPAPSATPFSAAQAPADAGAMSPEELAKVQEAIIKASQNPVGNIAVVPFQNNFNYGYGPYSRLQYNMNLQPVVPIVINPSLNLIARLIAPIVNNPSSAPPTVCAQPTGCPGTFGIGDINPQFYLAPKVSGNGLIWGAGAQMLFPTGTPSTLGSGKYGAGPAIVGLIMPGNIVTGVLVTQMFSIGGDPNRATISSGFIQPFFNYNLPHAWSISLGSSGITANWVATPQQGKWLVPVGGGVVKTFKLGDQPMQLGLLYYGNVVKPTNAPNGTIRFNWALLFPVKRGFALPGPPPGAAAPAKQ
jgi:hypothetical protein